MLPGAVPEHGLNTATTGVEESAQVYTPPSPPSADDLLYELYTIRQQPESAERTLAMTRWLMKVDARYDARAVKKR